jgi:hypothetical protein
LAGDNVLSPALQDFLTVQKVLTGSSDSLDVSAVRAELKNLSTDELHRVYIDLRYIDNLKTSRVLGAKRYTSRVKPVIDRYDTWDEEKKKKFIEAYMKLIEAGLAGFLLNHTIFHMRFFSSLQAILRI